MKLKTLANGWLAGVASIITLAGCGKYLDAQPDQTLAVPRHMKELTGLMEAEMMFSDYPLLPLCFDEDVFISNNDYPQCEEALRKAYRWAPDIYLNQDWILIFKRILNCNIVLKYFDQLGDSSNAGHRQVKGTALFFRAFNNYILAQFYAPAWGMVANDAPLGIPFKFDVDINERFYRSTMQQTYQKIIDDLNQSLNFLKVQPGFKTRPGKSAAYALLSRIYLLMGNYAGSLENANRCLALNDSLIDYSTLPAGVPFNTFDAFNEEVIWQATAKSDLDFMRFHQVNPPTLSLYDSADLRREQFFYSTPAGTKFKGNYSGDPRLFAGITTVEVYLTRSECFAKLGNVSAAAADLNKLLQHRYAPGTYQLYQPASVTELLQKILAERRKETIFRPVGGHWESTRRLFNDPASKTLHRTINGVEYILPPLDNRYVFLIPEKEVTESGLTQNPR